LNAETLLHFLIFPGGIFAVLFGLLLVSMERIMVARLQGRVGPPIYQNMLDVLKLGLKEVMIPSDAANAFFFRVAPVLGFAGMLAALFLLPIGGVYDGIGANSDLIVLLYLMALPAVSHIIGGSASGSPYSTYSVSREVVLMFAYEITFILVLFTVAYAAGGGREAVFSLKSIAVYQMEHGSFALDWKMWPALVAFVIFMLATLEVPPFHIAENDADVMDGYLMEYSGTQLALFEVTHALKLLLVVSVFQLFFMPGFESGSVLFNLLWYLIKTMMIVGAIALVHAVMPSFRVEQGFKFLMVVPLGLALASLLSVLYV